jgi:hypothetical protein
LIPILDELVEEVLRDVNIKERFCARYVCILLDTIDIPLALNVECNSVDWSPVAINVLDVDFGVYVSANVLEVVFVIKPVSVVEALWINCLSISVSVLSLHGDHVVDIRCVESDIESWHVLAVCGIGNICD